MTATPPILPPDPSPSDRATNWVSIVVFALVWIAILGSAFRAQLTPWLSEWWWTIAVGVGAVAVALIFRPVRQWLGRATEARRAAAIVFIVLPIVLIVVGGMIVLPLPRRILAVRIVFLIVVCLLPATLYYLFIVNRKYSLLNEFLGNLGRLGLLRRQGVTGTGGATAPESESVESCRRRVLTYLRRFEAVYGPVPERLIQKVARADAFDDLTFDEQAGDRLAEHRVLSTPETALPLVVTTILLVLGWILTLPPWPDATQPAAAGVQTVPAVWWLTVLDPVPTATRFAFLGAYFFSIQLLFRRYIQRDLPAKAYVAVSVRIVLAVIGAWVLAEVMAVEALDQDRVLILAFAIGVFPPVLWNLLTKTVQRLTGAAVIMPSLEAKMPVTDLDGITIWHQARLEETSIEDISDMATADLVDLLLATRFPPGRIIEWVDQALLCMHVRGGGEGAGAAARQALGALGIRNATSLVAAYRASTIHGTRDQFIRALPGDGAPPVVSLVDAVTTHPNFDLVWRWKGLGT